MPPENTGIASAPVLVEIAGLSTIVVVKPGQVEAAVVFLHGYAMSPDMLAPFAESLGFPAKYYFPQGPLEASGGGFCWWPQIERPLNTPPRDLADQVPSGRGAARDALRRLLRQVSLECPGIPVVLAGFSQGGMLACDAVLTEDIQVAAMALMSSSRIAIQEWQAHQGRLRGLRVFVSHGRGDPDLAFRAGENLSRFLSDSGAELTWVPFDGGHSIPFGVWRSFRRFLSNIVGNVPMQEPASR